MNEIFQQFTFSASGHSCNEAMFFKFTWVYLFSKHVKREFTSYFKYYLFYQNYHFSCYYESNLLEFNVGVSLQDF